MKVMKVWICGQILADQSGLVNSALLVNHLLYLTFSVIVVCWFHNHTIPCEETRQLKNLSELVFATFVVYNTTNDSV